MLQLFIYCVFVIQIRGIFCEQVVRTLIKAKYVKDMSLFINSSPDIDQWLSLRSTKSYFDSDYEYFADLKLNNQSLAYMVDKFKAEIKFLDTNSTRKVKRLVKNGIVGKYVSYDEITEWMFKMAKENRDLVRVTSIGRSFENRQIYVLKMSSKWRSWQSKPLFLFDSGIHAREWLSVATNIFLIDKLIKQFRANDADVVRIFQNFELHFVPLLNPDGYEYSRQSVLNRFWRKNMRQSSNGFDHTCYGVDLNRNFDHKWMVSGASANPCSEIYAGSHAVSEPEIKSLQEYMMRKSPKWLSHISMHSYGAIWLAPYSYSREHLSDNFQETCQKALTAIYTIEEKHGFSFRFGVASHELYEASGCSEDWSKDIAKVNHTFVIELKPDITDYSGMGFEYPEEKIHQAAIEIYDGFLEYIKTFLGSAIQNRIVNECRNRLNWIKEIQDY